MATDVPPTGSAPRAPEPRARPGAGVVTDDSNPHIIQMLFELQGTVGEMKEGVRALQQTVEKHNKKLDSMSHRFYAAGIAMVVLVSVITWGIQNFPTMKSWFGNDAKPTAAAKQ